MDERKFELVLQYIGAKYVQLISQRVTVCNTMVILVQLMTRIC